MISMVKRKPARLTFVLGILGDYGRVESSLARSIERLETIARHTDCQIVAAWEDRRWETVPLVQTLGMRFPRDRLTAICGDCPDQPATLFSAAANRAAGEILHFVWPGCLPRWDAVAAACRDLEAGELDWLGFVGSREGLVELCSPDAEEHFYRHYLSCGRPVALCQAVIRRTGFLAMNGFRKTPLLQREFDADYWLRSVCQGQKAAVRTGKLTDSRWTWGDFPLQKDLRVPRYLAHSYRVRTADCSDNAEESKRLGEFAADLSPPLQRTVERVAGVVPAAAPERGRTPACKIAVVDELRDDSKPAGRESGSMLTVALFSHSPGMCGAERMLLNLAVLLQRSKSVHPVLLVPDDGGLVTEARRCGLHYEIVPAAPWYLFPPRSVNNYHRGVTRCREALRRTLVDLNSDAVLVNTMTSVPAMLAAVELDLPSLVWVHGVADSQLLPGRSSEFASAHDGLLLHSATRVIALPNFTSDFCAEVIGRAGLDVIPNWTQVAPHFTAPAAKYRSRRIACLNTFDPHKGHATLLTAAALLKARQTTFELHLYGDGPLHEEMKNRAVLLGLQDRVRFHGRTSRVHEVYDSSLCVVNPADVEPFPMTLIEPMARKTPVVATRSGGPSDIVVDGQCGYLVDRGDAAALADRIQALLESPELSRRMGEEGFKRASAQFNEETAQAAFLPVIEGAVRDFHGYDPAVKMLAKIYRLWLDQAARGPYWPTLASLRTADFRQKAARLAMGGLRRTMALGRRMLTILGLGGAAISDDQGLQPVPPDESNLETAP